MISEGARRLWRRLSGEIAAVNLDFASRIGPRQENQDNLLILHDGRQVVLREQLLVHDARPDWPQGRLRVAVFDGMGGHRQGREVAEAAAEALARVPALTNLKRQRQAVMALHEQLARQFASTDDPASPGSTMVWLELDRLSHRGLLAQVGDSRAYLHRDGEWRALTHDHTLAEFNWRDGDLPEAQYRALRRDTHQRIAQALAYGSFGIIADARGIKPYRHAPDLRLELAEDLPAHCRDHADLRDITLQNGDRLLLATDGLWSDAFPWPAEAGAEDLVEAALAAGGQDNTTVVCLDYLLGHRKELNY